jgi:hypothetical protein
VHDQPEYAVPMPTVQLVDLATGACAPQPDLLHPRNHPTVGRLPDGRVVCVGGLHYGGWDSAEVWGPAEHGAPDAAWSWRELPAMSALRQGCRGCVMSDGCFAVLGGRVLSATQGTSRYHRYVTTALCEALTVDGYAHWAPLPPMHDAREWFACGAVAGCVIVAGGVRMHTHGYDLKSAELYDEELNRWLRLPRDLPCESSLSRIGGAVL